ACRASRRSRSDELGEEKPAPARRCAGRAPEELDAVRDDAPAEALCEHGRCGAGVREVVMAEEAGLSVSDGGERVGIEDARAEPRRCDEPPGREAATVKAVVEDALGALGAGLEHAGLVHAVV